MKLRFLRLFSLQQNWLSFLLERLPVNYNLLFFVQTDTLCELQFVFIAGGEWWREKSFALNVGLYNFHDFVSFSHQLRAKERPSLFDESSLMLTGIDAWPVFLGMTGLVYKPLFNWKQLVLALFCLVKKLIQQLSFLVVKIVVESPPKGIVVVLSFADGASSDIPWHKLYSVIHCFEHA